MVGERGSLLPVFFTAGQLLVELLSSSEDEEGMLDDESAIVCASGKLRTPGIRVENYSEVTVPKLNSDAFRDNFRLSREVFEAVLGRVHQLESFNPDNSHGGFPSVTPRKQLEVALWALGTMESFRQVADRFDISRSTCHGIFKRVVHALAIDIGKDIIKWPSGSRLQHVIDGFNKKSRGYNGIVGAIDGCHIPIKAPVLDPVSYVNRKGFHSILLQGVCDHELLFTDVYCGWPGRVHDARVFRNSPIATDLQNLPPTQHCIGDSAYPLSMSMIVPYKGALTAGQQRHNNRLSMSRQFIERCFALLKCRWRRLKYVDASDMNLLTHAVVACCVLHNLCLLHKDSADDMLSGATEDRENEVGNDAADGVLNNPNPDAKLKRNNIQAQLLALLP